MVAGTTTYDLNDVATEAILAEWDRTDLNFDQRISNLIDGGSSSLNGSYDLTPSTVRSNELSNTITSNSAGQSWIFARLSDSILNHKPSDDVEYLT
jgi:hypothetical protein